MEKNPAPTSRRRFLGQSLAAGAAAISVPGVRPVRAAEAPAATVLDTKVISQQPEFYHGWPTVCRRSSGELILTWSGRRESHVCPFGAVEMMRSRDEGETWTFPRTLLDSPIDDRDSGCLETATGALIVTTFTSLAYDDLYLKKGQHTDDPRWLAAHARLPDDEARKAELGEWAIRSTDGGVTWSERVHTLANSPHGPIQLADGRLLYPGKELWSEKKRIGVAESKDDGRTWSWLADIPTREGDDAHGGYHELHGVECAGGKLIVQIRNHNAANKGETLQTESTDGGQTWSVPHPIGVWGLPSHLCRLRDGRLVMTHGHRRAPFGNQARLSTDEGATWSDPVILSGDGAGGDLGYPSTVELADGALLTVWYEKLKDSPRAVLRQARWRLG
ncbi:MAG: exo-alpha-sialidase [Verrucomicrobiae bacterium]|nr:exo-alpha-sialidase [Verrucomicrobiae bacterium]MCP5540541.1 exo-alpha-sialidase [Akkermansiaceae bacterium]MCP5550803.1 exo-alpha-sialidase [Akkermansiaceae bacterium]